MGNKETYKMGDMGKIDCSCRWSGFICWPCRQCLVQAENERKRRCDCDEYSVCLLCAYSRYGVKRIKCRLDAQIDNKTGQTTYPNRCVDSRAFSANPCGIPVDDDTPKLTFGDCLP